MKKLLSLSALLLLVTACSDKRYEAPKNPVNLNAEQSAMLAASAIKQVHQLDAVLYPASFLDSKESVLAAKGMKGSDVSRTLSAYPTGTKDQFVIGTMKGSSIKKLLKERADENYQAELQVAGLEYHIHYVGGITRFANFNRDRDIELKDDTVYRVAISNYFVFSGRTFPSYKYRNSISRLFRESEQVVSARDSIQKFLAGNYDMPNFLNKRSLVSKFVVGNAGFKRIYEIQGKSHFSKIYGHKVKTKGIVTAVGNVQWYPGGLDVYIQDPTGDGDDTTSDGIHVYIADETQFINIGDELEVSGVVYERMTKSGMSSTSIREVESLNVVSTDNPLPKAVLIGKGGREIPLQVISDYWGDLNAKTGLDLDEGIDFYESLEGMRLKLNDPQIVGFRGGKEDIVDLGSAKGYLTFYVRPDGKNGHVNSTPGGGLIIDVDAQDEREHNYNPHIVTISTNHLTKGIDTETVVNVGDVIDGGVEGVLTYNKNIFGGGEFNLVIPQEQESFKSFSKKRSAVTPLADRPHTTLKAEEDKLTVAVYNLENLAGNQETRINNLGRTISKNLACPDIMTLVEVQDDNGLDFEGGSGASATVDKIIKSTKCEGANYKAIVLDPTNHNEGGQPGGNIQIAYMYNAARVKFTPRGKATAEDETIVGADGHLMLNPGKVAPNSEAFRRGTRKSLVAEFEFNGKPVFVIGNHLNSKLGDTSHWSNIQPPVFGSENSRRPKAIVINNFVQQIERNNPTANIVVLGDFNALLTDKSMLMLAGNELKNLMTYKDLVAPKDRYTTNHNGNSQSLDYIFANRALLDKNPEFEVLHMNSDYMGRYSDHDPLVARFTIK